LAANAVRAADKIVPRVSWLPGRRPDLTAPPTPSTLRCTPRLPADPPVIKDHTSVVGGEPPRKLGAYNRFCRRVGVVGDHFSGTSAGVSGLGG
jgi:hypothetical protein